jgi:hypothetical protein
MRQTNIRTARLGRQVRMFLCKTLYAKLVDQCAIP